MLNRRGKFCAALIGAGVAVWGVVYFLNEVRPQMLEARDRRESTETIKQDEATAAILLAGSDPKDAETIRTSAVSMARDNVSSLKNYSQMGKTAWSGLCSWGWKGPWHEAELKSVEFMRIGDGAMTGGGRLLTQDEQKAWRRVYAVEMLKQYQEFRGWAP
jgi:hypothetical protein